MAKKRYPLSSLEKYILAFETENFSFSSHLIIETSKPLEKLRMQRALAEMFDKIPLLRSRIDGTDRIIEDRIQIDPEAFVRDLGPFNIDELPDLIEQKFDLSSEPPLRLSYGKIRAGGFALVMTVHHVFIDGIGQGHLLNEFLLAYNGLPFSSWTAEYQPFSFRRALFRSGKIRNGLVFTLSSFKALLALQLKQRPSQNLVDDIREKRRSVRFLAFPIDEKEALIKTRASELGFERPFDFLLFCLFRAADRVIENKSVKPFSIITPLNLRRALKIRNSFHNIDGLCRITLSPEQVRDPELPFTLRKRIKKDLTSEKAFSIIVLLAVAGKFLSLRKLKEQVHKQEFVSSKTLSTVFVSAGKLPKLSTVNSTLGIERVYGFGSLTRSPGLGVILTGLKNRQTLVVEYLDGVISPITAGKFAQALMSELLGENQDKL